MIIREFASKKTDIGENELKRMKMEAIDTTNQIVENPFRYIGQIARNSYNNLENFVNFTL